MHKHPLNAGLDPDQQAELGDLSELEAALARYETPVPDSDLLLAHLQQMMPEAPAPVSVLRGWRHWMSLAHAQLSLVDGAFWWASALLLSLGIALVFAGGGPMAVVYALCSPVLAVIGTAYIFRPEARSLREFELLSPVNPIELLYARLLLLLSYNLVLALTLILLAWSQNTQLVLWRLLLLWFGPMVGLTGIALYVSLRWNAIAGALAPVSLWASLLLLGWQDSRIETPLFFSSVQSSLVALSASDLLLAASLLVLMSGFVMIWQIGRWAGPDVTP